MITNQKGFSTQLHFWCPVMLQIAPSYNIVESSLQILQVCSQIINVNTAAFLSVWQTIEIYSYTWVLGSIRGTNWAYSNLLISDFAFNRTRVTICCRRCFHSHSAQPIMSKTSSLPFYLFWTLTPFIFSFLPSVDPLGDDCPGSGIKCLYMSGCHAPFSLFDL